MCEDSLSRFLSSSYYTAAVTSTHSTHSTDPSRTPNGVSSRGTSSVTLFDGTILSPMAMGFMGLLEDSPLSTASQSHSRRHNGSNQSDAVVLDGHSLIRSKTPPKVDDSPLSVTSAAHYTHFSLSPSAFGTPSLSPNPFAPKQSTDPMRQKKTLLTHHHTPYGHPSSSSSSSFSSPLVCDGHSSNDASASSTPSMSTPTSLESVDVCDFLSLHQVRS